MLKMHLLRYIGLFLMNDINVVSYSEQITETLYYDIHVLMPNTLGCDVIH